MSLCIVIITLLDLQCSTDDDEDDEEDFQEVSEDENNAANILDQGERINATSSENMDFIDPKNIKTELDIEAQQMAGGLLGCELHPRDRVIFCTHIKFPFSFLSSCKKKNNIEISKCFFLSVCLNSVSIFYSYMHYIVFAISYENRGAVRRGG